MFFYDILKAFNLIRCYIFLFLHYNRLFIYNEVSIEIMMFGYLCFLFREACFEIRGRIILIINDGEIRNLLTLFNDILVISDVFIGFFMRFIISIC
jgi:hypothetical protein